MNVVSSETHKYGYGLIGNGVSAALVSTAASVDWACMPYFDSSSVFAAILDAERGGSFRVEGVDPVRTHQEYVRHTPILRTRIETRDGAVDVYDYMPRFISAAEHHYCPAEIHRSIRVVWGRPKIKIKLDIRPNYGASGCRIEDQGEFLKYLTDDGEYHSYYLYTDIPFEAVLDSRPVELSESAYLILAYHQKIRPMDRDRVYIEFERTKSYWLGWSDRTLLPQKYKDSILRSLITLKLMMYERTGAMIAAPTTSLPEIAGKDRNWDYRYCWIRDASMMIDLYSRLGHVRTSEKYMRFILDRMLLKNDGIAVMYGIHGEKVLTERTVEHLGGYRGSSPVRVGNNAYLQVQNDLYGELLDAIDTYFALHSQSGFVMDQELWTVVRSLVNWARGTWKNPDNGIWEYRGSAQHHVFSKLMNWVAMDRAARIAGRIGKDRYASDCLRLASEIKEDILANGWNDKVRAFTMFYGSSHADAAVLLMLHYGFLDVADPRMVQTVEFCHRELVRDGYVMRYTAPDDFGTPENAFLICTFWMVNGLFRIGRKEEARSMFDRAARTANHLGLMSEGVEPSTGGQTGNFPQGYSHMAFVQSALLLESGDRWDRLCSPDSRV